MSSENRIRWQHRARCATGRLAAPRSKGRRNSEFLSTKVLPKAFVWPSGRSSFSSGSCSSDSGGTADCTGAIKRCCLESVQTLVPMRVEVEWVDGQTRWVELQVRRIAPSDPSVTPGETGLFRRQPSRVSIPFHRRLEAHLFWLSLQGDIGIPPLCEDLRLALATTHGVHTDDFWLRCGTHTLQDQLPLIDLVSPELIVIGPAVSHIGLPMARAGPGSSQLARRARGAAHSRW